MPSRRVCVNEDTVMTSEITGEGTNGTIKFVDDHDFKDSHFTQRNELVPTEFTYNYGGYPNPENLRFSWDLTMRCDGNRQTLLNFHGEGKPVGHFYANDGRYNVAAKVQQEKEAVKLNSLEVEVGVGILDSGCHVQPCSVCEVGSKFEVVVVYSSREAVTTALRGGGLPAPMQQKTWAFAAQTRWSSKKIVPIQCVSAYTIEVSNSLSSKRCTLEIETQHPLRDIEAELEEASVKPPGVLALHVRYTGVEAARSHCFQVSVNWADESLTTNSMSTSVNDLRLTYRMSKESNLMLEVVVFNGVCSQRIPPHPIISAFMDALIDELDIPGFGGEHECFTTDDSTRFGSVFKGGAINVTYVIIREVNKGITTFEQTYPSPSIVYKTIAGEYKATAKIGNTINVYIAAKTMCIQGEVRGKRLSLQTPNLYPWKQGQVRLPFVGLAERACVCVDLGNGRRLAHPPVGDTKCGEYSDHLSASRTLIRKSLVLSVVCDTQNVCTITASIGRTTAELNVTVASANCYPPRITLESPNIAKLNTPVCIRAEDGLTAIARSNATICPHFEPMVCRWEIFKLGYMTAGRVERRDSPQAPSTCNLQANVPHYMLEPGHFEAYLEGMIDGVGVYSAVSAFIAVAELTHVIRLERNGEEMISVSECITALCLSPAKHSFNPNTFNAKPREASPVVRGLEDWQVTCTQSAYEYDSAVTSCELPMIDGRELGELCIDRSLLNCTEVHRFQA
ncbi:unnamed protein product [Taenia asiatica]|uniref:VWFD domain-containing protein n=1 Tax=Taenia asiatica TaxID=60517 RepID=A0A0R3VWM7_TAEAS|nr:unnamed protein product [Taenia asiatica]